MFSRPFYGTGGKRPEKAKLCLTPRSFSKLFLFSFPSPLPEEQKNKSWPTPPCLSQPVTSSQCAGLFGYVRRVIKLSSAAAKVGQLRSVSLPGDEVPLVSCVCLSVSLSASRNLSVAKHCTHSSQWRQCQNQVYETQVLNSSVLPECGKDVQQILHLSRFRLEEQFVDHKQTRRKQAHLTAALAMLLGHKISRCYEWQ